MKLDEPWPFCMCQHVLHFGLQSLLGFRAMRSEYLPTNSLDSKVRLSEARTLRLSEPADSGRHATYISLYQFTKIVVS